MQKFASPFLQKTKSKKGKKTVDNLTMCKYTYRATL